MKASIPSSTPRSTKHQPRSHSVAVWEFTLKCNLKCRHCGSSAGKTRASELTTSQALDVVRKLADLGVKEVNLIGGEATLREDWAIIGKAITDARMHLGFQTGGLHIGSDIIKTMEGIGTTSLGVSLDGIGSIHDHQRGVFGSYERALDTLEKASNSSIPTLACSTQINRSSYSSLLILLEKVAQTRVRSWQLSQTLPMGVGAAATDLHLQPADFATIHELSAIFAVEAGKRGILGIAANPLGYFGPYERLIRSGPFNMNRYYSGCPAAKGAIGIEADGTIKGCPSLPTDPYQLGKSYQDGFERLANVWDDDTSEYHWRVSGFCSRCPFQTICWSGCGWSTTTTMGQKGNNPYCMYRSIVHYALNKHERLEQRSQGSLEPFACGSFNLVNGEGLDGNMISMDSVSVPKAMEETTQAFRDKRKAVFLTSLEVFKGFNSSMAFDSAKSMQAFEVMERLSLPLNHLQALKNPREDK